MFLTDDAQVSNQIDIDWQLLWSWVCPDCHKMILYLPKPDSEDPEAIKCPECKAKFGLYRFHRKQFREVCDILEIKNILQTPKKRLILKQDIEAYAVIAPAWECPNCEQMHVSINNMDKNGWIWCVKCGNRMHKDYIKMEVPGRVRKLVEKGYAQLI